MPSTLTAYISSGYGHPEAVIRGHVEEMGTALQGQLQRDPVPQVPQGHLHRQACQSGMFGVAGQDPDGPPLGQQCHHHRPAHEAGAAGDQG